jgi:hypothetical protein
MFHFKTSTYPAPKSSLEGATRRPSQSEIVSTQRRGSSSLHHNAVSPGLYGAQSQILQSMTTDLDEAGDIQRTGSGGLLMRKRTFEEKDQISRARAAELSALYELSESKEFDLNHNAMVKTKVVCAPSIGNNTMTAKQAFARFAKQERDYKARISKGSDPLLAPHELKERERLAAAEKRRAEIINAKNKGPNKEEAFPDTFGIEIVARNTMRRGISIVNGNAVQAAATKPRSSNSLGYRAANGIVYEVENLC